MSELRLIIFSDIHYLDKRPEILDANLNRKLTQYSEEMVEKLIEKINQEKPDLSVCLGDLIEDKMNHDKDIVNFTYIWNKLKNIKVPFYSLVGNHDLRTMKSRKELENIMKYPNATFSFDLNNYHFILLNTNTNEEDYKSSDGGIERTRNVSEAELEWLKNDLSNNKMPCIMFTHFGIAEDKMINNYWFEKEPEKGLMGNRKEIKDIICSDDNIIAIFSGHQHWTKKIRENEKNYYICGSLIENMHMAGKPDGVYLDVKLNGKNVEVNENHICI